MIPPPLELVADTVPSSVGRFRRFAVDACRDMGLSVDDDTLALLVSEVTTNALVHGQGEVRLRLVPSPGSLRIEVSDASPALPRSREVSPQSENGRGMALVEMLSSAWGTEPRAGGKAVWFEVACG